MLGDCLRVRILRRVSVSCKKPKSLIAKAVFKFGSIIRRRSAFSEGHGCNKARLPQDFPLLKIQNVNQSASFSFCRAFSGLIIVQAAPERSFWKYT